jgi:hypothetical protein
MRGLRRERYVAEARKDSGQYFHVARGAEAAHIAAKETAIQCIMRTR